MAHEFAYADPQNPFPDDEQWDIARHGYVGPVAPEYQSGGYYDAEAFAASSIAPREPLDSCYYDPDPDPHVAFGHYVNGDDSVAHPSSAFGFLHYLPPAAISKKYYALQDPNVYPTHELAAPSSPPPPPPLQTTFNSESASPIADSEYAHATPTVTSSPALKLEVDEDSEQPATAPPPSPLDVLATAAATPATPTLTPPPTLSPAYYHQEFHFHPSASEGWHPARTPSGPPECAHPVLPKQRRNRDDPGGGDDDAGRLAQVRELEDQTGVGYPCVPQDHSHHGVMGAQAEAQQQQHHDHHDHHRAVVPSQWKVGAVLDRLRFPQYGGDWDAVMAAASGEPYRACMPRSTSPLSAEELAQLEHLKAGFGLPGLPKQPATPMTPITPPTPGTGTGMGMDVDDEDKDTNLKIAVYSPMTGQRIPVTAGPNGLVLRLGAVPPGARRPHKRGAVAACAFCRRRKIACGGPKEGDEARRCGQCIQRQQPCEFPGTSYEHARPVALAAPPFRYARPEDRAGASAPR